MCESCTFTKTGREFAQQPVFRCRTCKLIGNLGTCLACSIKCHNGHDIFYDKYISFFCDCGERGEPFCKMASGASTQDNSKTSRQVFECPVCFTPMRPPIFMCERSHNVCATCRQGVVDCPLCRGKFSGARNLAMETLSKSLQLDCEDCGVPTLIADFDDHKKMCSMSEYPCPLQPNCPWVSKLWDIFDHCKNCHPEKILQGAEHQFEHSRFTKTSDFETNIIAIDETLFMFHRQYHRFQNMFQAVVKQANSVQESKFTYTLTFDSPSGEESVVIKKKVRPLYEAVEKIYCLHNGANLYMDQITSIVHLNTLPYTLKITPV